MNEKNDKAHEDKVAAARARMGELGAKFVERSAAELVSLRTALARFRNGDALALGEIRHLAHRMAGTGATLGFETFSDRALDVEHLAERQAPDTTPDSAALERLEAALQTLEKELRALQKLDR